MNADFYLLFKRLAFIDKYGSKTNFPTQNTPPTSLLAGDR